MDFSDEWQQEELSDAELLLRVEAADATRKRKRDQEDHKTEFKIIRRVPVHKLILCRSPYFRAQVPYARLQLFIWRPLAHANPT